MRIVCLLFIFWMAPLLAEVMPRHILAFYNGKDEESLDHSLVHQVVEMPLNFLGMDLLYYDINEPLPDINALPPLRAILTFFSSGTQIPEVENYLSYAIKAMDQGIKYIILEEPGLSKNEAIELEQRFWEKLGLINTGTFVNITYGYKITAQDNTLTNFELAFPKVLPPFLITQVNAKATTTFLTVSNGENHADLITIGQNGAMVATCYAFLHNLCPSAKILKGNFRRWYINPFLFFTKALQLENFPTPDVTTLAGRRICYSQIDGDGWNNVSQIDAYRKGGTLSAKVVMKELLETNPDIPVACGVIGADVDRNWVGTKKSERVARRILKMPNIEVASHTYSHPFDWGYFETHKPEDEVDFLHLYPYGSWQSSALSWLRAVVKPKEKAGDSHGEGTPYGYVRPRAFANEPFDLNKEIKGSLSFVETFAPEGKKATLIQWSGNCLPWDTPLALSREAGVRNINGGNNRFDAWFPSYCYLSGIGRKANGEQQIYASNENENTYTFEWTKRFYGFQYLVETLKNTETPRRIKPINLYYHMYSGEKLASLNAVKQNIEYIRTQEIIPLWTSHFAAIADGFFSAKIDKLTDTSWRIEDRGELQTIRFDNIQGEGVDFKKSSGVIGEQATNNSLYVYLDKTVSSPVIALGSVKSQDPYLVGSRWQIYALKKEPKFFSFKAKGFGPLEMSWHMPQNTSFKITATLNGEEKYSTEASSKNNLLKVSLPLEFDREYDVKIEELGR